MKFPRAHLLGLLVLLTCVLAGPLSALETPDVITMAEARAHLARGEHARVRVCGHVTFSSPKMGLAFAQDETGGLAFDPRVPQKPAVRAGDHVELTGVMTRRQGMVMILRDVAKFGAPEILPIVSEAKFVSALPFDLDQAGQMQVDGLSTRVSGVIRRVDVPSDPAVPLMVEISTPSGYAIARLPWRESAEEMNRWLNMPVICSSAVLVCQAQPPLLPSEADALLLVPAKWAWQVQRESLEEVFARAPARLSAEMLIAPRTAEKNRLHIQGIVTSAKRRQWLTLRTNDGPVQVLTRQMHDFALGDRLSVACWARIKGGRITLLDGICRRLQPAVAAPAPIAAPQGFMGSLHPPMELVKVTGMLRNHSISGGVPRLTLTLDQGMSCLLQWHSFLSAADVAHWQDGSRVSVTGILDLTHDPATHDLAAIHALLPRSLADIEVLKGPSWWTPARMMAAVTTLFGIASLALAATLVSRWQIGRQRKIICAIEAREIAEEERRRIAREFHDSLQQQLAAAALHLETLKGAVSAAPEMLPRLLDDTTAMLRHCQLEARHCIWDLRSELPGREDLGEALDSWLKMRAAQTLGGPKIDLQIFGKLPLLTEEEALQIMRITQEAVNNSLAHAGAEHILVQIYGKTEQLQVSVGDDGRGFDFQEALKGKPGHYGLHAQRERAQKIHAKLDFTSHPDSGTHLLLSLPLAPTRTIHPHVSSDSHHH